MNITIKSNFKFTVKSITFAKDGGLSLELTSDAALSDERFEYSVNPGEGVAGKRKATSLLEYARNFYAYSDIKPKTKDSYRLMCKHLQAYGDCAIEEVSTAYLQGFVSYLQGHNLKVGTVRLYFRKIACVLHEAYKDGLFDERILLRVKRPKREQEKKCFLTENEIKKLMRHGIPDKYDNIQSMFLFACLTGLRFGDIQTLRWKDVKVNGKHLSLEFHQNKTNTKESLPLCAMAEELLRGRKREGEHVFGRESNQQTNKVIKKWCKFAKIRKPVSFHSARHTFCVLLLTKDVPIYTVQRLMCHSDIGTTNGYADLTNKSKAKAVRRMPKIAC